ncbi:MAG: primosomal protein N' [Bdellovibrionales bacterium]|nr:primosomal protein N' [Bdellovibrionales bacterium]
MSYGRPKNKGGVVRGQSVRVPLGKRKVDGVVVGFSEEKVDFAVRPIESISAEYPPLPEPTLAWLEWLSRYYFYPLGQTASLCFPPLKKSGRGSRKNSPIPEPSPEAVPILTQEQESVLAQIRAEPGFSAHLLHGVTGSGKTEVYLRLIEDTLAAGKKVLVLVPEISLTPQLLRRFSNRFPDLLAVLHSHLTDREKTEQWWSIIEGDKKILVGARSALFCPLPDIGLVVIDEEHEPSFKQDEMLKYHARDAAIMLAREHNCPIILGSATPSLESWHNARQGKFKLHTMSHRVAERKMPDVEIVDMRHERDLRRQEPPEVELPFWLSQALFNRLVDCFKRKDQAALFLNRRGVAQYVFCPSCGLTYECPNCSISLTLHGKNHLVCHYCDYHERLNETCRECGSLDVGPLGLGTELLERDIGKIFPEIRVTRADRDEIQNRQDLEDMISKVENREIDLLIGTQMIAKGLDFKGLNLVGLVMADVGFNLPDFRASERSFQLLIQVGGRAGRHSELPGQVVIQTYNPDHLSVQYSCQNDYVGFADEELNTRRALCYPPHGRLGSFRIMGNNESRTLAAAEFLGKRCSYLQRHHDVYREIQILGPAPAPIAKLRGKFRFQILIKSPDHARLAGLCRQALGDEKWIPSGVKVLTDIDPVNLL